MSCFASKPVGAGFSLRPGPRQTARAQAKDLRPQTSYQYEVGLEAKSP
jgi:hypothetical protein